MEEKTDPQIKGFYKEKSGVVRLLVEATPDFPARIKDELRYNIKHQHCYVITITFDPKYKIKNRLLSKLEPLVAIAKTQSEIVKALQGYGAILIPEFGKRQNLHYHGIAWHKSIRAVNSIVQATIKHKLQKFGRIQQVDELRNPNGYVEYITKEVSDYHESLVINF